MTHRLILASGSPRRRELLNLLGIPFEVRPVDLDETPHPGEDPIVYVERLAREKAAAQAQPGELVLAADTTVFLDGEILGKPEDPEDARRMLRRLSARTHQVATGVALHDPATTRTVSHVDRTPVTFRALEPHEIDWYVATGEPMDKAGAYAIQGAAGLFITHIEGVPSNVVGLPLPTVGRLFEELGIGWPCFQQQTPRTST